MEHIRTSWGDKPYYSLDYYMKQTYGEKIYKIALDANLTCPNRDGTLDTRGCIFCSAGGSGEFATKPNLSVAHQLDLGIASYTKKEIGKHYIAYFQSFTNTYGDLTYLRSIYTQALSHPLTVGISIATRPDCLSNEVLSLLKDLQHSFPMKTIWIELGLQTIHATTANYIRRGYNLSIFEEAVDVLHHQHIPIIVHTILGLPGESDEDVISTVNYLNNFPIMGLKLQLLHVLQNTDLATDYENGVFSCMTQSSYTNLLITCLEHLSPEIVIHRITGDGAKDQLIAPLWSLNKRNVLNTIHQTMKQQGTYQGRLYYASRFIHHL